MNDTKTIVSYTKIFLLSILFLHCTSQKEALQPGSVLHHHTKNIDLSQDDITIAFGSCSRENLDLQYFENIHKLEPDAWIWLGDIVYGDTEDMTKLENKYAILKNNSYYQSLISDTPVFGIWDDHDYGENNAGKEYPKREESRNILFNFLDVEIPNREGAYQAYDFESQDNRLKIILLDSRYFRDNPTKIDGQYIPDSTLDILGKIQWEWFQSQLANVREDELVIIANGIQVLSNEHQFEKWGNFPSSRQKILDLIEKCPSKHIVLLTGDRHTSELSQITLGNKTIFEITSSGLTHSYEKLGYEPNKYRTGPHISQKSFANLNYDFTRSNLEITFYEATSGKELFNFNSSKMK